MMTKTAKEKEEKNYYVVADMEFQILIEPYNA